MFTRLLKCIVCFCLFLGLVFPHYSCACNKTVKITKDTPIARLFKQDDVNYLIKGTVDLKGGTYIIPDNCSISLRKGVLINGVITGSSTTIKHLHNQSIGVVLKGSWACEKIHDRFFDLSYLNDDQVVANINALQSDNVDNEIILEKPSYNCSIPKNDGCLLLMSSNSTLRLNTKITISGNNFTSYNIIRVKGKDNVTIAGGCLEGDVGRHTYVANNSSQWGHGINIYNSKDVTISDIEITHCIGDGIAISGGKPSYIGGYSLASKNITVKGVKCNYNRRQGISLIYADGVEIIDSDFSDTGVIESHSPSAGIDIEPNTAPPYYQSVRNVNIKNCTFLGNVGYSVLSNHYESHNGAKSVDNVLFSNCKCDSRVVLYTGGISFEDTEMKELSLLAQKDPITGIYFKRCRITGGNGIHFYCPFSGLDVSTKIGDILFENCEITASDGVDAKEQKGLIWCRGRSGRMRNVTFKKCSLRIPENASSRYELFGMDAREILLDNCIIDIPGRQFPTTRVRHSNCQIFSKDTIQ